MATGLKTPEMKWDATDLRGELAKFKLSPTYNIHMKNYCYNQKASECNSLKFYACIIKVRYLLLSNVCNSILYEK